MVSRDDNDLLREGHLPQDPFEGARPLGSSDPSAVSEDWPAPAPLRREETGPPLPLEGLPDWCQRPVAALAANVQSPLDFVICVALGIASGGVMGRYVLDHNGYEIHPNLSALGVLPSGERKSDPFARSLRPLTPLEVDLRAAREDQRASVRAKRDALEARKRAFLRKINEKQDAGLEEAVERIERELADLVEPGPALLIADDVTPEQAAVLAQGNQGLLRVYGDEGAFLQHLLGRYSDSPAVELFLNGWNGGRAVVHRVKRDPVVIHRALVSVVGAVQPAVIQEAMAEDRMVRRGALARFLMVLPAGLVGKRKALGAPIDPLEWSWFEGQLRQLYRPSHPISSVSRGGVGEPARVVLTPAATAKFSDAFDRFERRRAPGGDLAPFVNFVNKFDGHVLKLALVLWAAEHEMQPGTGTTTQLAVAAKYVERAVAFMEAQTEHQVAAVRLGRRDRNYDHAGAILDHIARHGAARYPGLVVSLRDLHRCLASRFDDPRELDGPIGLLERLGWLRRVEAPPRGGPGRPPSDRVRFHPKAGCEAS